MTILEPGVGAGTGSAAGGTAKTSPPPSPGGQAAKTKKMRKDSAASGAGELPGVTQWAETGWNGKL